MFQEQTYARACHALSHSFRIMALFYKKEIEVLLRRFVMLELNIVGLGSIQATYNI